MTFCAGTMPNKGFGLRKDKPLPRVTVKSLERKELEARERAG